MSRKKKSRNQDQVTAKILLTTAVIQLIHTVIDLVKKLFE